MRALLIAVAAFLVLVAPASAQSTSLVINEVDYDQPSTDTAEFLEIKNVAASAINLDPYAVRFVNGANNAVLPELRSARASTSPPGGHYVVCGNAAPRRTATWTSAPSTEPDPERRTRTRVAIVQGDTASSTRSPYGGAVPGVAEGTTAITDTADDGGREHRRVPDGCDTNDNGVDFARVADRRRARPTAGSRAAGRRPTRRRPSPTRRPTPTRTTSRSTRTSRSRSARTSRSPRRAFAISCASAAPHDAAVTGGPSTYTLDPTTDFARGEQCTVTVNASQVTDTDANDPPDTMAANFTFSFTTLGIEGLRIHDIQGMQHRSPYENHVVSGVPGVVTAAEHQRHLGPGRLAGRRQPHVRGHLPLQPERAAAGRHRGHVQRLRVRSSRRPAGGPRA